MHTYENRDKLKVARQFIDFIEQQAIPGTQVASDAFWSSFARIVHELSPINQHLLDKRAKLQSQIDDWYIEYKSQPIDADAYQNFLQEIGYLVPEASQEITISYSPEEAKVCIATAIFKFSEGEEVTKTLKMSAIGKFPFLNLNQTKIDFEELLVGKVDAKKLIQGEKNARKAQKR